MNQASCALPTPSRSNLTPVERSLLLLYSHLNPQQLEQMNSERCFEVRGGKTGRLYRISSGVSHNVSWIVDGKPYVSYCAVIYGRDIPWPDHLLAQKLAVETDDVKFTDICCSVLHVEGGHRLADIRPPPMLSRHNGRRMVLAIFMLTFSIFNLILAIIKLFNHYDVLR